MPSTRLSPRSLFLLFLCLTLAFSAAPGLAQAEADDAAADTEVSDEPRLSTGTFSGLAWRGIGPALMSGRISDVVIDPNDLSTWYVAVGSGGVWKTSNAGTTWTPIFDDQGSYSIGCLTIDPNDSNVVWVGTGENVGGRHVAYGDGVYKSLDGGGTWTKVGLETSEHIGNIIIDPRDSDVVYVAAQGPLWSSGGERGLYKTTDGGENWTQILGGGPYTGVNEVHFDPRNPDILYAATHQRFRNVAALVNGGPESGIHKSTDGGETWRELSKGLPDEDMGKIGLAVSPHDPDTIYATIELGRRTGGFWRSLDAGATWEKRSDYLSGATGPHYYQEIFADPHRPHRVYQMDARMHLTDDGGKTFRPIGEEFKHGDNHAMAFFPNDPDDFLVGSDGGLYRTFDAGATWRYYANLPVTQFYKVAVDDDKPFYNIYGGTQDNNTQGGPSRTLNVHGIRNSDWFITLFGDGHQPATEPGNPDIVYSQWQQGNLVRYDRTTREIVYIQPQPAAGEPAERWNWDSPILVSPHDPKRLYFASQRVWRSDDRGDSWRAISGDLSLGIERLNQPMMGRRWSSDAAWDLWAMSNYGNVTSLSESPLVEGLLYAGTDDGLVQISDDGGATWRRSGDFPGVPDGAFVNDIKADLHQADTVYLALDDHKSGDFRPFLLVSSDRGQTWRSIAGDPEDGGLPDRHLVWRVVQDHVEPSLLFAGTEFGVFATVDGGKRWFELAAGMPQIGIRDLAIQTRENDLVAASFGRGFFVLDDYTPLRGLDEATLDQEALLFQPKDALWYLEQRPLGGGEKATQGAGFFTAPNPPFGAVLTYYLRDGYTTSKADRQKEEKEIAEKGEDNPPFDLEALHEEAKQEEPAIVLTVRDADGRAVRRVEGAATPGVHRVAWDLRHPSPDVWRASQDPDNMTPGLLAVPGTYTVEMAKRIDGSLSSLGEPRTFQVTPVFEDGALPRTDPAEAQAFLRDNRALLSEVMATDAILDEWQERLEALRSTIARSAADPTLRADASDLLRRLYDLRRQLDGDPILGDLGEPQPPSIGWRLTVVEFGNRFSTYGPTPMHRENFAMASREMTELRMELKAFVTDAEALEARADEAGVPWTPGRGLPGS